MFENNIDKLIEAISTQNIILISRLKNDYTVDNHHQTTAVFEFIPVKIIYHRGAFLIAGFLKSNTAEIVLYEISQLEEFTIRKEKFNLKDLSKTLNDELDNRFGITKNIDDKVYDIKLEFTNITGSLVRKYTWHHSQKFILYEGNYIMTLKCGINRELLGWIFQWMYNVRILEPQQLIDVYKNSLVEMQSNRNLHTALKYKNIFEPKL